MIRPILILDHVPLTYRSPVGGLLSVIVSPPLQDGNLVAISPRNILYIPLILSIPV